jgi:hypothetical protein
VERARYYGRSEQEAWEALEGGVAATLLVFFTGSTTGFTLDIEGEGVTYAGASLTAAAAAAWVVANWPANTVANVANPAPGFVRLTSKLDGVIGNDYLVTSSGPINGTPGNLIGGTGEVTEFTYPPVAKLDSRFSKYGFADDTVVDAPEELKSLYIVVKRRFLRPLISEEKYSQELDLNYTETRQIVAKGTEPVSFPGTIQERMDGNAFHDVMITRVLQGVDSYPHTMTVIPRDFDFNFPPYLRAVRVVSANAYAASEFASPSYSEDWFVFYDLVDPTAGPYRGLVTRYLTSDPAAIEAAFPVQRVLQRREVIGYAKAWFVSGTSNETFAQARQMEIPPSVHGEVEIENADIIGFSDIASSSPISKLSPTPGFDELFGALTWRVQCRTRKTDFDLYEVSVGIINIEGLYENRYVDSSGTIVVEPPPVTATVDTPTGAFNADGSIFYGSTSSGARISAKLASEELDTAVAGTDGRFELSFSPRLGQGQVITITASAGSLRPATATFTAPTSTGLPPIAWLNGARTTLAGWALPDASIRATVEGTAREIQLSATSSAVTATGDVEVTFTADIIGVPIVLTVGLTNGQTDEDWINEVYLDLIANASITDNFNVSLLAAEIIIVALDTGTAGFTLDIDDVGTTGVGPFSSTENVPGLADAAYTGIADGTGAFSITVSVVPEGNEVNVFASDDIGESGSTVIIASLTPPAAPTADATASDGEQVEGVSVILADVTVYDGLEDIGSATAGGGGAYTAVLDTPRVDGQTLRVQAVLAGSRSPTTIEVAPTLNYEPPQDVRQLNQANNTYSAAFVGVAPAAATSIVLILPDLDEVTATIHANRNFSISPAFADSFYYQGEVMRLVARYSGGGQSAAIEYRFPVASISPPRITLNPRPIPGSGFGFTTPSDEVTFAIGLSAPGYVSAAMTTAGFIHRLLVSMPGSATADFVINLPSYYFRTGNNLVAVLRKTEWIWNALATGPTVPRLIEVRYEWGMPGNTLISDAAIWNAFADPGIRNYTNLL